MSRNTTSSAKSRVAGSGPDRKFLSPFEDLGTLSSTELIEVNNLCDSLQEINDLQESQQYQISDHCPLKNVIPENFQHILLTHTESELDPRLESSYKKWLPEEEVGAAKKVIDRLSRDPFRVRFSLLPDGKEFSWHIDTNTSVACRFFIPLNEHDSTFEIKVRDQIHFVPLEVGHIYFVNTGWSHRVVNHGKTMRKALLFGSRFEDMLIKPKIHSEPIY